MANGMDFIINQLCNNSKPNNIVLCMTSLHVQLCASYLLQRSITHLVCNDLSQYLCQYGLQTDNVTVQVNLV